MLPISTVWPHLRIPGGRADEGEAQHDHVREGDRGQLRQRGEVLLTI